VSTAPANWQVERITIGRYGGSLHKADTSTETIPYAWGVYLQMQASRGTAYTTSRSSLVHVENIAIARFFCGILRSAERLSSNGLPGTSDDSLDDWVQLLAVQRFADDDDWQVRQRAAAAYALLSGNDASTVDALIQSTLGAAYVGVIRTRGVGLSSPPDFTYWPSVNPGPSDYDLGGGTWFSHRAHLSILVNDTAVPSDVFQRMVEVDLSRVLDRTLPAWCSWSWSASDGFLIDISRLGIDGI
jgi:hypothetical protein